MSENPNRVGGTDSAQFLEDLNAGVFKQKLDAYLSAAALAAVSTHKPGKVVLEITLKPIGESSQVEIKHLLKFEKPTNNGSQSEKNLTTTPMHVLTGGRLSLFPAKTDDLFKEVEEN